mmetsp:Transcript_12506/g.31190  ORF Transcript_12506/g.31190 Transcript_12506/m.31190 type:complete len:403 (+) Transcript_12506:661-1869(+)
MYARQAPPPGTMPSAIAPRTALIASSYRSLLSSISVSVCAPTMIRATAPRSLTIRCSRRWISNSLSVPSLEAICALICCTRVSTSASNSPEETSRVLLFEMTARSSRPRSASCTLLTVRASSSLMNAAPVKVQMSSRKARRTAPKPGALTTHTSMTPRSLLSTRPACASPMTSCAMMSSGSLDATTLSRTVMSSLICEILASVTSTRGLLSVAVCASTSLTNFSLSHPTSCSMPSVYSITSCTSRPISTVVEPSYPTLKMASATCFPISSEPDDTLAMKAYCSYLSTGIAISRIFETKRRAPWLIPRCSATELAPFATSLSPARTIACVSTVDVVVPSPARESVCCAACSSSLAPTFSSGSERTMLSAMVTPSFTTRGSLFFSCSTTLRPLGPRVTLTALAT